jgi:hypothetical protein
MARHKLTPDDRRRGQAKGAETKRARRDEAEQEARDTLADAAGEAVETLRAGLKAEDANVRTRSALAVLAYAWGRPRQALEHSGGIAVEPIVPEPTKEQIDATLAGLVEIGLLRRNNGDGE